MRRDLFLEETLRGAILVIIYYIYKRPQGLNRLTEARLYENLCKADSAVSLVPLV